MRPPTFSSAERNFRRLVTLDMAEENLGLEKDDVSYLKQNPTTDDDKRGSGAENEKGQRVENCWGVKGLQSIKEVESGNESFVSAAHVCYRALLQEIRRDFIFIECALWSNNHKIEKWIFRKFDNLALRFMSYTKFLEKGKMLNLYKQLQYNTH